MKKIITLLLLTISLNIYPADTDQIFNNANNYLKNGMYDSAINELEKLLSSDDNTILSNAYFYTGYCYQVKDDAENAIKNYETSLKYNKNAVHVLEYLGTLYMFSGIDMKKGHDCLYEAYKLNTVNNITYFNLCWYYVKEKQNIDRGIIFFDIAIFHNSSDLKTLKQNILWPESDIDMKLLSESSYYKKLINNLDSLENAIQFFYKAYEFQVQANYKQSVGLFNKSIQQLDNALDSNSFMHAVIYNYLGESLRKNKEYEAALKYQNKALEIFEEKYHENNMLTGTTNNYIGFTYLELGEYKSAYNYLLKSLKQLSLVFNEDHEVIANLYTGLGDSLYSMNDYKKALIYFNKTKEIRKKISGENSLLLAEIYFDLGNVYKKSGELDKALDMYIECLNIWEKNPETQKQLIMNSLDSLVEIYDKKQEFDRAIDILNKMLAGFLKEDTEEKGITISNIGYYYMRNKNYSRAVDYLNDALNLFQKLNIRNTNLFYIYYNLAKSYNHMQDYKNSIKYSLICLDLTDSLLPGDHEMTGEINNIIGINYNELNEPDKAFEYYQKALNNYQKIKYYQGIAVVHNNLSIYFIKKGLFKQALSSIKSSLKNVNKSKNNDMAYTAIIYENIGYAYEKLSDYKQALIYYNKSLNILDAEFDFDHPEKATVFKNIGSTYSALGLLQEALSNYNKSLTIIEKYHDRDSYYIAEIYNAIAVVHNSAGNFNQANEYFLKALDIHIKNHNEKSLETAVLFSNLGRLYYHMGQFETALIYQHKSIDLYEKILKNHPLELATAYNTTGITYSEIGDFEKALNYQEKALKIRLEIYDYEHPEIAYSYNDIGLTYNYMEEFDKALEYFNKALKIKLKYTNKKHPSLAIAYNNIGLANSQVGKNREAIKNYSLALNIYRSSLGDFHPYTALAYHNIALGYMGIGDFKNAGINLIKSLKIAENNRSNLAGESKARAELFAKSNLTYKMLIKTLYNLNAKEDAFYYFEKSKSRGMLDDLSGSIIYTSPEIDSSLQNKIKAAKQAITLLNEEIVKRKSSGISFSQEQKDLIKLQKEHGKLLEEIYNQNPGLKDITQSKIYKINEIQKALKDDEAVIEFSFSTDTYAFVITGQTFEMIKMDINYDEFLNIIDIYRELVNDNTGEFYIDNESNYIYSDRGLKKKAADEKDDRGMKFANLKNIKKNNAFTTVNDRLFNSLVKPLIPYIEDVSNLKIIPDSQLSFIPFEAIMMDDNFYFIEKYNISYIQSCAVLINTRQKKNNSYIDLLAFGGAVYSDGEIFADYKEISDEQISILKNQYQDSIDNNEKLNNIYNEKGYEWGNLPGTKKEVEEIGKFFYKKDSADFKQNILTGLSADEKIIKNMNKEKKLKKYRMIHFAAHGLLEIDMPELSAIVLSLTAKKEAQEDGYLTMSEILTLDLDSELVTLSACETGLGKIISGEGVVGLTQSFLIAGSKNVIVSLWKVSDEATKDFMIIFYKKIQDGIPYKQALRETKIEFINSGKWEQPFYWAPFILFGE